MALLRTSARGTLQLATVPRRKLPARPRPRKVKRASTSTPRTSKNSLLVARDTYGLEVDSTMDEATLRAMIEQAQADEGTDDDKAAKKTKKRK